MKKATIKEIHKFLKTLEENRYKRLVKSECRRIAWFVNNDLSEDYDAMPDSLRKKWVKAENEKRNWMSKNSLYREDMEHASCGVGLVVSLDGSPSRKVVENGIDALKAIWHRGAVDADGKTGDGAGIHTASSISPISPFSPFWGRRRNRSRS